MKKLLIRNSRKLEFFSKKERLERYAEIGKISHELFHDILNPLSGIILYLEILNNSNEMNLATKELNESGDKIRNFIKLIQTNLLSPENEELINITDEINHIIKLLYHKAKINNTSIVFISKKNTVILFSKIKFYQLIINLLSNAIDSYENTSPIKTKNKIIIKVGEIFNQKIEIKIIDNGCGIQKNDIKKIFKGNYSSKKEGFGIGLKTVLNIIKEYKGEVEIESEINKGTSFNVLLPVKP